MGKTFLYHGYLDPFTKIDFSVHLPIAVGFFYIFFWIIYPPGIIQMAGKSLRASSFGAAACAWHAPRRPGTN
jgi:hypothetical protein